MRDVIEDVETSDALGFEKPRGLGPPFLEERRERVSHVGVGFPRALHVEDRLLEHALESERLDGLLAGVLRKKLDPALEVPFEVRPQAIEIDAASGQDLLALRVVGDREQKVLEGEVRVPPRVRLAIRQAQDQLQIRREHQAVFLGWLSGLDRPHSGSMLQRKGCPASSARSSTMTTLVSATSNG